MMYHQPTNEDRRDEAPDPPEEALCSHCNDYPCRCLIDEQDEMEYL
jgi:hypothetical protein